jgi:hypothetical protein
MIERSRRAIVVIFIVMMRGLRVVLMYKNIPKADYIS